VSIQKRPRVDSFVDPRTLQLQTCEEADESAYWLELLVESGTAGQERVKDLIREVNELVAIFGASRIPAKQNLSASWNRHSTVDNRKS
jgi:hypothetical protein